jgi:hypothetical protein
VPPAPPKEPDTNYLAEVVGHPVSTSSLLATITAAAVLSVIAGGGLAAVPVLFWMGAQSIAALFLPSSPVFREWVDKKKRAERREAQRTQLVEKIRVRLEEHRFKGDELVKEVGRYGQTYERMRDRLAGIAKLVAHGNAALSAYDLEKLDDGTVDYLRIVLARITLRERIDAQDERDLEKRIDVLDRQIEKASSTAEEKKLSVARDELQRLLERRRGLPAQDATLSTQLLSMSESYEELYHQLSTSGGGAEVARFLKGATERMQIEEEIALDVDSELEALTRGKSARASRAREGQ